MEFKESVFEEPGMKIPQHMHVEQEEEQQQYVETQQQLCCVYHR